VALKRSVDKAEDESEMVKALKQSIELLQRNIRVSASNPSALALSNDTIFGGTEGGGAGAGGGGTGGVGGGEWGGQLKRERDEALATQVRDTKRRIDQLQQLQQWQQELQQDNHHQGAGRQSAEQSRSPLARDGSIGSILGLSLPGGFRYANGSRSLLPIYMSFLSARYILALF
jgi:hypothetical protein